MIVPQGCTKPRLRLRRERGHSGPKSPFRPPSFSKRGKVGPWPAVTYQSDRHRVRTRPSSLAHEHLREGLRLTWRASRGQKRKTKTKSRLQDDATEQRKRPSRTAVATHSIVSDSVTVGTSSPPKAGRARKSGRAPQKRDPTRFMGGEHLQALSSRQRARHAHLQQKGFRNRGHPARPYLLKASLRLSLFAPEDGVVPEVGNIHPLSTS